MFSLVSVRAYQDDVLFFDASLPYLLENDRNGQGARTGFYGIVKGDGNFAILKASFIFDTGSYPS